MTGGTKGVERVSITVGSLSWPLSSVDYPSPGSSMILWSWDGQIPKSENRRTVGREEGGRRRRRMEDDGVGKKGNRRWMDVSPKDAFTPGRVVVE